MKWFCVFVIATAAKIIMNRESFFALALQLYLWFILCGEFVGFVDFNKIHQMIRFVLLVLRINIQENTRLESEVLSATITFYSPTQSYQRMLPN
jgi:uncharacterized membrane protein